MRAQSAALGIAAAAALSSTAPALPCAMTAPGELTISEFTCTISEGPSISPARDEQADTGSAGMTQSGSPLSAGPEAAFRLDPTVPDELAGTFTGRGIKITNLQATMTSNRYVAGRLPLAEEAAPVEDLIMFSPDYLSTRTLPRIPKRNPVGVGLVTLPKPVPKELEKSSDSQGFQQTRP
jgi:hypothetical protein